MLGTRSSGFGIEAVLGIGANIDDDGISPLLTPGLRAVWYDVATTGPQIFVGFSDEYNPLNGNNRLLVTAGAGWSF